MGAFPWADVGDSDVCKQALALGHALRDHDLWSRVETFGGTRTITVHLDEVDARRLTDLLRGAK